MIRVNLTALKDLATKGELKAYKHEGFWQCMDTKREHEKLEKMWSEFDVYENNDI